MKLASRQAAFLCGFYSCSDFTFLAFIVEPNITIRSLISGKSIVSKMSFLNITLVSQEIRNRVQALAEARDLYDRIRRQGREGSGLGVTNYPERPLRVAATGENDESRSEIRRVPRDDTQRSYR